VTSPQNRVEADAILDGLGQVDNDITVYVCENGLKLKLRPVRQLIIYEAERKLTPPRVPTFYNEQKGRDEPNPADPAYQDAFRQYQYTRGMIAVDTYYILGTKPIEPLPADVDPVDSPNWVDMLEATGANISDIPPSGPRRYLAWLKYHAVPDTDMNVLINRISLLSGGVSEEQVRQAEAVFRGNAARDTAQRVDPASASELGARVREQIGAGPGAGVSGGGEIRSDAVESVDGPAF